MGSYFGFDFENQFNAIQTKFIGRFIFVFKMYHIIYVYIFFVLYI